MLAKSFGIVGWHGSTQQAHSGVARNARDDGRRIGCGEGEKTRPIRGGRVGRRAVLEAWASLARKDGEEKERAGEQEEREVINRRGRREQEEER